jgi:hypothetical protein
MAWEKTDSESESESEAASQCRFSQGFWMGDSSYGGPGGVQEAGWGPGGRVGSRRPPFWRTLDSLVRGLTPVT